MKKLDVIAIDSYLIDEQQGISKNLVKKLYLYLSKYYHLANQDEFEQLIIQPDIKGELTILYGMNDDVAGFSRTYKQLIALGKKQVTIYYSYVFLNPHYKTYPTAESAGLTQAINYKLANPQEELIYIGFANNPLAYEFMYQLSESIYPKPLQKVPEQILTAINAFKKQNGWITTGDHPLVVNSPLVPIRGQNIDVFDETSEINEFFVASNPDYMQGNSILVYMPLHLANIGFGLSYQDSAGNYNQKPHHNPRHPDGDLSYFWS